MNKIKSNKSAKLTITITIIKQIIKNLIWLHFKQVKFFIYYLEYSVTAPLKNGFARPVILHRAIFGSL